MKLSSSRVGAIGEQLVAIDLLSRDLACYTPICDDKGVDLITDYEGTYYSIQVKVSNRKYSRKGITYCSIPIDVSPTNADIIAVPWKGEVIYFFNKQKNHRYGFHIQVETPKNNQWNNHIDDYKSFPPTIKKGSST